MAIPQINEPSLQQHEHTINTPCHIPSFTTEIASFVSKQLRSIGDSSAERGIEENNSILFKARTFPPLVHLWPSATRIKSVAETVFGWVTSAFEKLGEFVCACYDELSKTFLNKIFTFRDKQQELIKQALVSFKQHNLITPTKYLELEKQLADNDFEKINSFFLHCNLKLSRQDYERVMLLLNEKRICEAFCFAHTCLIFQDLNSSQEWDEIISREQKQEIVAAALQIQEGGKIYRLHNLVSTLFERLTIKQWIAQHRVTDELCNCEKRIAAALRTNNEQEFAAEFQLFVSQLASYEKKPGIQKCTLEELEKFVAEHPKDGTLFEKLAQAFSQTKYFDQWNGRVEALQNLLQKGIEQQELQADIEELEHTGNLILKLYCHYGKLLETESESHVCPTLYAAKYGSLVAGWRKTNSLFGKFVETANTKKRSHLACNCHYFETVDPKNKELKWKGLPGKVDGFKAVSQVPEFNPEKTDKSVLFFFCTFGAGHKSASDAIMSYSQLDIDENKFNYHIYSADVPREILLKTDTVNKVLGKFWAWLNTTTLWNYLNEGGLIDVMNFLRAVSDALGPPSAEKVKEIKSLIRQAILKQKPDLIVMTYTIGQNPYVVEVAEELGIPVIHVAADLEVSGWEKPPTHPEFKYVVAGDAPKVLQLLDVGKKIRKDQLITDIGPCVRLPFEEKLSAEDVTRIRQERGIRPEEKVVLFTNGGGGLPSNLSTLLATQWNPRDEPLRIIIVTGSNEPYARDLRKNLLPKLSRSPNVKVDVLGFIDGKEMATLMQIADTFVGKPGGLSLYEVLRTGVPFLGDQTRSPFYWEKFNNEVVIEAGAGDKVTNVKEIVPKLKALWKKPRVLSTYFNHSPKPSHRYVALMSELIQGAEANAQLLLNRQDWTPIRA